MRTGAEPNRPTALAPVRASADAETVLITAQYVRIAVRAVAMAVSVPLILRMVPMNRAYGIRVRKAFASEQSWYDLNAYGGKVFLVVGALLVVFGLVTRGIAPAPMSG